MFRIDNGAVAEPSPDVVPCDHPVPLSVLALDIGLPAEGWPGFLGARAMALVPDDIGRDSVTSADARRLLAERREAEARKAAKLVETELQAIEQDRLRRAQIWKGLPSDHLPVGAHPAAAMLAAAQHARPRRVTPLQEALAGESLTFHSFGSTPEDES
jgi:hypothetical protein